MMDIKQRIDPFINIRCEPIYPKSNLGRTLEGDIVSLRKSYETSDSNIVDIIKITDEFIIHGLIRKGSLKDTIWFWDAQGYALKYPAFITQIDIGDLVKELGIKED